MPWTVGLDDGARHTQGTEQPLMRYFERLAARRVLENSRQHYGGSARVAPKGTHGMIERLRSSERRHIRLEKQHARHIGYGAVTLVETQAARHRQKIGDADIRAAIAGRPQRALIEPEPTVLDQNADESGHDGLAHRPAELRCARVKALGVALRDEAPMMDDEHGAGRNARSMRRPL